MRWARWQGALTGKQAHERSMRDHVGRLAGQKLLQLDRGVALETRR
jgi:hypothetical protein